MLLKKLPGLPTVKSGLGREDGGDLGLGLCSGPMGLSKARARELRSQMFPLLGTLSSEEAYMGHLTVIAQAQQGTTLPSHTPPFPPPTPNLACLPPSLDRSQRKLLKM